jgi:hypothetical protein
MERAVRENDFVLIICTPRYKLKSDKRTGGVGYEGDIITGEVLTKRNHRKFIPILRKGEWEDAAPTWLAHKLNIDFRGGKYSEHNYQDLLATLHSQRLQPPPVGQSPFKKSVLRLEGKEHGPLTDEDSNLKDIVKGVLYANNGYFHLATDLFYPCINEISESFRKSGFTEAIDNSLYPPRHRHRSEVPHIAGANLTMAILIFLRASIRPWTVEKLRVDLYEGKILPSLKKLVSTYKRKYESKGKQYVIGIELEVYYELDNFYVVIQSSAHTSQALKLNLALIAEAERKALDWVQERGITNERMIYTIKDGSLVNYPKLS